MKNLEELLSKEGLSKIKFPIERNYYTFGIKKKSGKIRKITAPSDNLKQIQNLILYRILYKVRPHFCATGFIPGFSIQSGAKQHIGNKALINIDLKNFFPSVKEEAVLETFREVTQMLKISFSGEDLKKLSSICCLDGGLPQVLPLPQ